MDQAARVYALEFKVAELERKLELVMRHVGVQYQETGASAALNEAAAYLRQGNKLEAMKVYQQRMGVGLKDAKDAIDALEARLRSGG